MYTKSCRCIESKLWQCVRKTSIELPLKFECDILTTFRVTAFLKSDIFYFYFLGNFTYASFPTLSKNYNLVQHHSTPYDIVTHSPFILASWHDNQCDLKKLFRWFWSTLRYNSDPLTMLPRSGITEARHPLPASVEKLQCQTNSSRVSLPSTDGGKRCLALVI